MLRNSAQIRFLLGVSLVRPQARTLFPRICAALHPGLSKSAALPLMRGAIVGAIAPVEFGLGIFLSPIFLSKPLRAIWTGRWVTGRSRMRLLHQRAVSPQQSAVSPVLTPKIAASLRQPIAAGVNRQLGSPPIVPMTKRIIAAKRR